MSGFRILRETPAALGYRMPAEWEPHAATWLSWPHKEASWPGNFAPIPGIWAEMVLALAAHERVEICVVDAAMAEAVGQLLADIKVDLRRVHLHPIPTDD